MIRVLIAENDFKTAKTNEKYISLVEDFETSGVCKSVDETVDFLKSNDDVDLVLLDLSLSSSCGEEVMRQIVDSNIGADVIVTTSQEKNDRLTMRNALRLGAVDYLIKPYTFERFKLALEKYRMRNDFFNKDEPLDQKSADLIVGCPLTAEHPKGIQEKTMQKIVNELVSGGGAWMSGEMLAEKTGLTGVTVRKYMNYLSCSGKVCGEMNYDTGGRPCMRYRIE